MTSFLGSAALAGAGTLVGAGTPAVPGTSQLDFNGVLRGEFASPIYLARAVSTYDSAGVSTSQISVPVPEAIASGDYGLMLIAWVPSVITPTLTASGWDMLVNNSGHPSSPFAVLTRLRQSTDGTEIDVDFGGQSLLTTVAVTWYPEVGSADVVGVVSSRNGTSGATTTAGSVSIDGAAGGMAVAFFAERSAGIGTAAVLSNAAPRVFLEGTGTSSASVLIADSYTSHPGPTGDIIATYNTPSGNGSGVLVGLLPVGAVRTGFPSLSMSGVLNAAGVQRLGTPVFTVEGTLSASGRVRGRVNFGVSGSLTVVPVVHGSVSLSGSGQIKIVPVARGTAGLGASGALAATGTLRQRGTASLTASGALNVGGTARAKATVGFTATGRMVPVGSHPSMTAMLRSSAQGTLTAVGRPRFTGMIALSAQGAFVSRSVLVRARDHVELGTSGVLGVGARLVRTQGVINFYSDTETVFVGGANFTTRGQVFLEALGRLSAVGGLSQVAPTRHTTQPYYIRQTQSWVVQQERQRHTQAIYQVGEPALFVLMWKVEDYASGLVTRCPRCADSSGSLDARVAAVYQQPQTARCAFCFGTTFYGGVRAKIRRPAIVTDADEDERRAPRGVIHNEQVMVQTVDDFRVRTGDYLFRRDGSRWQLGHPQRLMVRTGFGHPTQVDESVGYGQIPASREDRSSVAYDIPPTAEELIEILTDPQYIPQPN